jgi:histidinol-phosphate aminotransferase
MSENWAELVAPNVNQIAPYEPGKPVDELERELGVTGAIKLASNENPLGPSPRAMVAARAALAESHRYPDGSAFHLRAKLADKLGVPEGTLTFGGGSNELIELLIRTLCRPGKDEVVTHRYAFFMYRIACQAHGVAFREADVHDDLSCDVDQLLSSITPATKVVFLPNPNNPTGSYVARTEFERLLSRLPSHVILVVDEAYHEYATTFPDYPVAEAYRSEHPRIVTLRTFSKIYGLAALRVGYAIANPRLVGYLNRVRMPFNVCTAAQEAARAALDDAEHVERSRRTNGEGLTQLRQGLSAMDVRAYPSAGNFVLVDIRRDAAPIYERLLRKGVIVRPLRPSGLLQHLRISIGTAEENARALAALEEVLRS